MVNLIVILVLAVVIGGAALYIYKAKKHGVKCIGCPSAKHCGSCPSCQSCACVEQDAE